MSILCVAREGPLHDVLTSLSTAGFGPIEVVGSVEDAVARAQAGAFRMVVFDPGTLQGLSREGLRALLQQLGGAQAALLGDARRGGQVLSFLREGESNHIIGGTWSDEGTPAFDPQSFFETMQKVATGAAFGVAEYLAPGTALVEEQIDGYPAKAEAVRAVGRYAETLSCRRQQVARIEAVADELLLNGIYDAPALRFGKTVLGDPAAPEVAPVMLRYGGDGTYFVIGVRDVYGELTRPNLLDHLELATTGARLPRPPSESQTGGAGLGLHLVLDAVTHLVASVNPKQETEVIGILDLRISPRVARNTSPSVSLRFARNGKGDQ